jgi:ArsR family transcriptional regulator
MFYRLAYPEVANLLTVARSLLVKILETTQQQLVSTVNLPEIVSSDGDDGRVT